MCGDNVLLERTYGLVRSLLLTGYISIFTRLDSCDCIPIDESIFCFGAWTLGENIYNKAKLWLGIATFSLGLWFEPDECRCHADPPGD